MAFTLGETAVIPAQAGIQTPMVVCLLDFGLRRNDE
jgi:hypothetical protein